MNGMLSPHDLVARRFAGWETKGFAGSFQMSVVQEQPMRLKISYILFLAAVLGLMSAGVAFAGLSGGPV
jgi:hypothetical protein